MRSSSPWGDCGTLLRLEEGGGVGALRSSVVSEGDRQTGFNAEFGLLDGVAILAFKRATASDASPGKSHKPIGVAILGRPESKFSR